MTKLKLTLMAGMLAAGLATVCDQRAIDRGLLVRPDQQPAAVAILPRRRCDRRRRREIGLGRRRVRHAPG